MYIFLFWPARSLTLNGKVTRREEFIGQQGSQLRVYGKIYTLRGFTSGGRIR